MYHYLKNLHQSSRLSKDELITESKNMDSRTVLIAEDSSMNMMLVKTLIKSSYPAFIILEAGMNDFLTKPIDIDTLKAMLDKYLQA